jgi:hypothetical protein
MAGRAGVRGGFLSFLGVVSYRIRILMYSDVSCMYLECILKDTCIPYVSWCISKCILNALLYSKRIHVS